VSHQSIGGHDTAVLRRLAERVAEIAADPAQEERADLWLRTNRLERVRPPINVHLEESCWPEVLPDADFETSHPEARMYETMLRRTIWEWEHLADDRLTEAVVEYPVAVHDSGIGVVARKVYAGGPTSACEYVPAVVDESDIDSIELPELTLDREQTERDRELVERVFAGILEPVPGPRYDVGRFDLIDRWSELRGIEQMYLDMVERPEWMHEALRRFTACYVSRFRQLEELGVLQLDSGAVECYVGGYALTDQLPQPDFDGRHVRLRDLWGFNCAQPFVSVSPEMHEEFSLRYAREVLALFGLTSLGCCEPLHDRLGYVTSVPNLRRISMNEWTDLELAADVLGAGYVLSYKPTGRHVALAAWDGEAVRKYLTEDLGKLAGCVAEVVQNAISTCRGEPRRITEWSRIAREVALESYK